MPESQEYLEANLGYDPEKAKEYFDKAMEECGLDSLTLTLSYNETSANNKMASADCTWLLWVLVCQVIEIAAVGGSRRTSVSYIVNDNIIHPL